MKLQAIVHQKGGLALATISTSVILFLVSCSTYKNASQANPIEKNCGGYETTGYTRKTDTTDVGTLHGEVRLCKTGKLIQGAHIYVLNWKDSIIAETITDNSGKYSLTYPNAHSIDKISVSAYGAALDVDIHDIGQYHKNTELNMRLYEVVTFSNDVPLTEDDLKQIERNRNK